MTVEEDFALLSRWRQGDQRAGSDLLSRHFETLHRFFWSKANGHVEDLIQQTCVACVEARETLCPTSSFRSYLLSVARHKLFDHYRKHYRAEGLDFTSTSVMDMSKSPTGALSQKQDERLLSLALQQIPVDQQIALELTYWENLSAPEIAIVLGIPENTVYSRLRRAKENLRKALGRLSDQPSEREQALSVLGPTARD
jgi:RNA polymerase sigma factor (sigma-70 family)